MNKLQRTIKDLAEVKEMITNTKNLLELLEDKKFRLETEKLEIENGKL